MEISLEEDYKEKTDYLFAHTKAVAKEASLTGGFEGSLQICTGEGGSFNRLEDVILGGLDTPTADTTPRLRVEVWQESTINFITKVTADRLGEKEGIPSGDEAAGGGILGALGGQNQVPPNDTGAVVRDSIPHLRYTSDPAFLLEFAAGQTIPQVHGIVLAPVLLSGHHCLLLPCLVVEDIPGRDKTSQNGLDLVISQKYLSANYWRVGKGWDPALGGRFNVSQLPSSIRLDNGTLTVDAIFSPPRPDHAVAVGGSMAILFELGSFLNLVSTAEDAITLGNRFFAGFKFGETLAYQMMDECRGAGLTLLMVVCCALDIVQNYGYPVEEVVVRVPEAQIEPFEQFQKEAVEEVAGQKFMFNTKGDKVPNFDMFWIFHALYRRLERMEIRLSLDRSSDQYQQEARRLVGLEEENTAAVPDEELLPEELPVPMSASHGGINLINWARNKYVTYSRHIYKTDGIDHIRTTAVKGDVCSNCGEDIFADRIYGFEGAYACLVCQDFRCGYCARRKTRCPYLFQ
ncbi:hypothetical protein BJ508DRAFT_365555 [Ascobolus immersus RN42]|uniref:Uncharacterized protein n=1 Tax=Ascobolus immersus RN42 TaxID=1160509 RepID=A0A3N4HP76_ASCIM|nr:hypothetical protein BJ508DRAFT_365555 [Ascobolus immersus RN42]